MSDHHKEHPEYGELGIFSGYGEFDPLPCPFCGELPTFTQHFRPEMGFGMTHRCKVLGPIVWDHSGHSKDDLVAKWNTRK